MRRAVRKTQAKPVPTLTRTDGLKRWAAISGKHNSGNGVRQIARGQSYFHRPRRQWLQGPSPTAKQRQGAGDFIIGDASQIHVVLTFDDNFWAPAFAAARSICLTTTRKQDVVLHLIHDGLREERKTDFAALVTEFGCSVVHTELKDHAEFNAICRSLPVDRRLHTVMYARLLLDRLLPAGISRAIYLDCDTLVLTPIERLFEWELEGKTIGAVSDPVRMVNMLGRDIHSKTGIFESTDPYFNSGVLVIDLVRFAAAKVPERVDEFRRTGILEKLYFDQDMLNLIFKGDWIELPWRFNVMDPRVAHQSMHPFILHYTGRARPWQLYSTVGHRRTYRHVMTNELFYRYMRHRWVRSLKRLVGLR